MRLFGRHENLDLSMEETPSLWRGCRELDRQDLRGPYFTATSGTYSDDLALEPLRPSAVRLRRSDWDNGPRIKRPVDTVHGGPPSTRAVQTTSRVLCSALRHPAMET